MRRLFSSAFLLLAACATPQERCISDATKDLRTLNARIEVAQGNIARGYALARRQYRDWDTEACGVVDGKTVYCRVPEIRTRTVRVPIDLDGEQGKLSALLKKQIRVSRQTEAGISACRTAYPEV